MFVKIAQKVTKHLGYYRKIFQNRQKSPNLVSLLLAYL